MYPAAIGDIVGALGRWRVVVTGDPIVPPLRVEVETDRDVDGLAERLRGALGAQFEVVRLNPGTLPVAEHKTPLVERRP